MTVIAMLANGDAVIGPRRVDLDIIGSSQLHCGLGETRGVGVFIGINTGYATGGS